MEQESGEQTQTQYPSQYPPPPPPQPPFPYQNVNPVFGDPYNNPQAPVYMPGQNDLYNPLPLAPLPKETDGLVIATLKFLWAFITTVIGMTISVIVQLALFLLQPIFTYMVIIIFSLAVIPLTINMLKGGKSQNYNFYHPFTLDIANMLTFFTCNYPSAIGFASKLDDMFHFVFQGANVSFMQAPMHCLWEVLTLDDFPCILPGENNTFGECKLLKQERHVRKNVEYVKNKGDSTAIDGDHELSDVRKFQDGIIDATDKQDLVDALENEIDKYMDKLAQNQNSGLEFLLEGVSVSKRGDAEQWVEERIREILFSSAIREIVVNPDIGQSDVSDLVVAQYKKVYNLIMDIVGRMNHKRKDTVFERVRAVIFSIQKRLEKSVDIDSERVRRQLESMSMTRHEWGKSLFGTNVQVMDHFVCCHTQWGADRKRTELFQESIKKCRGWQFSPENCAYRDPLYNDVVESMRNLSTQSEMFQDTRKERSIVVDGGYSLMQTFLESGGAFISAAVNFTGRNPGMGVIILAWEIFSRFVSWFMTLDRNDIQSDVVLTELDYGDKEATEEMQKNSKPAVTRVGFTDAVSRSVSGMGDLMRSMWRTFDELNRISSEISPEEEEEENT